MNLFRKIVFILTVVSLLLPGVVSAQGSLPPVPPAPVNGYIVDQKGWISPEQAAEINQIITALDNEGIAEIAILTTDDCGGDVSKYRLLVLNTWGIGHADDNDGLLIGVCWYNGNPDLRTMAQEVGPGLQGTLPDVLVNKVAKEIMRPYIAVEKHGAGLLAMVRAYNEILRGGDYNQAIERAIQPLKDNGTYVPDPSSQAAPEMTEAEAWAQLLSIQICGLGIFWWILIIIAVITLLYWIGIWTGTIERGTFDKFMEEMAKNSNNNTGTHHTEHHDSTPLSGGHGDGGGANTRL